MSDVLITPASSKIEFKDASSNIDGTIKLDSDGNLELTSGNGISLGDTSSDVFIGNGTDNVDLKFEADGSITGTSGVTLTLGSSGSNVAFANGTTITSNLNISGIVTATEYHGTFKGTIDSAVTGGIDKIQENNTKAEVVDSGSNGHFLIETEGTERLRIDSDGRTLFGNSTNRPTRTGGNGYSGQIQMESNSEAALTITRFGNTHPSRLNLQHARGTIASIAAAQNNDDLGQISFSAWDGDTFTNAAEIRAEVDGTPGDDDMPGRLILSTTADGANSVTERLRINSNGVKIIKNGNLNIESTYIDFSGSISTPSTAAAIFRPADNTLAFSTANEERLRITVGGDVGIGTDNPTGANAVSGNTAILAVGTLKADTITGSIAANVGIGTAPPSATSGDLWWDSDDGDLHIYYDDGSGSPSAQWVSIGGQGAKGDKGESANFDLENKLAAYTIASTDKGKLITNDNNFTIDTSTGFSAGDAVSIHNKSGSTIGISTGTGVMLRFGGSTLTGDRSLTPRGLATIVCLSTNVYIISGAGVL